MKKPTRIYRNPRTGAFLSKADWLWAKREAKARGEKFQTKAERRQETVTAAFKERGKRTRGGKGKPLKAEYRNAPKVEKRSAGKGWRKKVTTYRVTPDNGSLMRIADDILKAREKDKVQVAIGTGLGKSGDKWAGTRLTSKRDASIWLQGIGKNYAGRFNPGDKTKKVVVEVIVIERTAAGRKARSSKKTGAGKRRGKTSRTRRV